jgi:hypothetical protein
MALENQTTPFVYYLEELSSKVTTELNVDDDNSTPSTFDLENQNRE